QQPKYSSLISSPSPPPPPIPPHGRDIKIKPPSSPPPPPVPPRNKVKKEKTPLIFNRNPKRKREDDDDVLGNRKLIKPKGEQNDEIREEIEKRNTRKLRNKVKEEREDKQYLESIRERKEKKRQHILRREDIKKLRVPSKNKSVVSPPRLDRRKRDLESTPSIDNLQSPPKASPPISPPRLDRKRKRDLQTPPRIDDLSESQPKINTILKTPPKISPPKVNKPASIEKNKAINIKEKDNAREKDKTAEKKISENEPSNDRQKKSGVAGQTLESSNQTSASQIEINKEENRQRIKSMHVIPPAITPLFALGLPNTENTNNKTVVKDNDDEITIEEDKEENTNSVDTNKFTLWRGGQATATTKCSVTYN
uniref:Uncharacterized protein n=1 Tax=Meloidogyne floridensis TaxID=298350 RepID=A0A915P743_9BILA